MNDFFILLYDYFKFLNLLVPRYRPFQNKFLIVRVARFNFNSPFTTGAGRFMDQTSIQSIQVDITPWAGPASQLKKCTRDCRIGDDLAIPQKELVFKDGPLTLFLSFNNQFVFSFLQRYFQYLCVCGCHVKSVQFPVVFDFINPASGNFNFGSSPCSI